MAHNHKQHWIDMPEFHQPESDSFFKVIVRFRNREDVGEFCKRLEIDIHESTTSIWFPMLTRGLKSGYRFIEDTKTPETVEQATLFDEMSDKELLSFRIKQLIDGKTVVNADEIEKILAAN